MPLAFRVPQGRNAVSRRAQDGPDAAMSGGTAVLFCCGSRQCRPSNPSCAWGEWSTHRGPQEESQGAKSNIMRPKKIILCVDDNEQELSVTKFLLFTNGYKVFAAINAQEALGIFAEQQIDLVLADHTMPQMTGGQLINRLKQIAPHIPMILLGDPQR